MGRSIKIKGRVQFKPLLNIKIKLTVEFKCWINKLSLIWSEEADKYSNFQIPNKDRIKYIEHYKFWRTLAGFQGRLPTAVHLKSQQQQQQQHFQEERMRAEANMLQAWFIQIGFLHKWALESNTTEEMTASHFYKNNFGTEEDPEHLSSKLV